MTPLRGVQTGLATDQVLHRVFEQQVTAQPDAPALSFGATTWSFAQLDQKANQLAHYLLARGLERESTVALCLPPSPDVVVSMLAVLKAGGAYVPLDPAYPRDRLRYMISDSAAAWVLTHEAQADALGDCDAAAFALDTLGGELKDLPTTRPETPVRGEDLAYVIYTSGTTGRPKGVMIEHGAIVHRIRWRAAEYGLGGEDRILHRASTSFDASVLEIFGTLLAGAHLVVAEEDARRDPAVLVELMRARQITGIEVAPSLLRAMLDVPGFERCEALRNVFCGGEALTPELANAFTSRFAATLINVYGPAEVCVDATHWRARSGEPVQLGPLVGDVHAIVLDEAGEPVAEGEQGELYLGGVGVARGYWRRPELTAERFVPDPFSALPGARLYRTGDRVRTGPDGLLEFVGRVDHQVKIRGIRVELEELDAALAAEPGVREAVAQAWPDARGDNRLVGYVVTSEPVTAAQLRRGLARRLPVQLVPAQIVFLSELPLSPNGKVARDRLPPPPVEAVTEEGDGAAATLQDRVLTIFRQLLGTSQIAPEESFFLLGGHSLVATQLVQRLREAFSVELPLRCIFDGPSAAEVAREVEARLARGERASLPPLLACGEAGPHPLSFAQERVWFLVQLEPTNPYYNELNCIHLGGELDIAALGRAFTQLAGRHEVLRTRFVQQRGVPVQVVDAPPQAVDIPLLDLSHLPAGEQQQLTLEHARARALDPFDLEREAAWRVALVRLAPDRHLLLLVMHHIVTDGWSIGIMLEELGALYGAEREQRTAALGPVPVQYADFTRWQREWLSGERFDTQLAYWRGRLAGAQEALALPFDKPRPALPSYRGERVRVHVSPGQLQSVRALCAARGITPFIALEAIFRVLLLRVCAESDALVGTAVANRRASALEGAIGFFANTLVLRTDLSGDPTFEDVLRRCRDSVLEAQAHQDLPFEKLVEELNPERTTSRMPLIQVAFQLQNAPVKATLPGLEVRLEELDLGVSKLDLWLSLEERGDGLEGVLEFNADVFERVTAERLVEQYLTLLDSAVRAPTARISRLAAVPAEQRRLLLERWGRGEGAPLVFLPIHRRIEEQVDRAPDALALVGETSRYTYLEMDSAANRLAARLVAQGLTGSVVAGLIERSPQSVIALLAVLKAGASWLPLDVAAPEDRLRYMISEARARALIGRGATPVQLGADDLTWIPLEEEVPGSAAVAGRPDLEIDAEAIAYVIFTSGSTGRPKSVAVAHRGITNMADAVVAAAGLSVGARASHLLSPSFDASLHEVLTPLASGATLHVAPADAHLRQGGLAGWVGRERITHLMGAPPSVLPTLPPGELPHVQRVITGGEALSPELVARWTSAGRSIVNMYGPTEVTITATWHDCQPGELGPPIGRPLSHVRIYVLDEHLELVPPGAPGELFVGGVGVGLGYVGDRALTADRFVPDPFAAAPGERMYRTGDRVRFRSDGALMFLGRVDEQVKVRGHRIEPGEISSLLTAHPSVSEAVVIARNEGPSGPQLVAYVVEKAAGGVDAQVSGELVTSWRDLFDRSYGESTAEADPTFNIQGWNSSYTGEPIPAEQMREWTEATVARIRSLQPKHVIEMGCGSGLLLFRIAPHCESYLGADFSREALEKLAHHCQREELGVRHVRLSHVPADDWRSLKEVPGDVVVINSVAQYFPDAHYLYRVIEGAIAHVGPGGRIFLGDIRSRQLLEPFAASIQLARAEEDAPVARVEGEVRTALEQETELVVGHDFFRALLRHLPTLAHVDIRMKRGAFHNELTSFRYDVVLHVGRVEAATHVTKWEDGSGLTDLSALEARIQRLEGESLALRGLPDARVRRALRGASLLRQSPGPTTVGELRRRVAEADAGLDPEQLARLAEKHGWAAQLGWWESGEGSGAFDVVFTREAGERPVVVGGQIRRPLPPRELERYTNSPARRRTPTRLATTLKAYLQQHLPEYMIPFAFIRLDQLPLSPSGKVDRRALPAPEPLVQARREDVRAPQTGVERVVAQTFADVLAVEDVGADDGFFDLGGHSLLAAQLIARLRRELGVDLPIRAVFQAPTVSELARVVLPARRDPPDALTREIDALTDEEVLARLEQTIASRSVLA